MLFVTRLCRIKWSGMCWSSAQVCDLLIVEHIPAPEKCTNIYIIILGTKMLYFNMSTCVTDACSTFKQWWKVRGKITQM